MLLLSKGEWNEIGKKQFHNKYILVYDFDNNQLIKEIAVKISKKNLKIYSINPGKINYADKYFRHVVGGIYFTCERCSLYYFQLISCGSIFSTVSEKFCHCEQKRIYQHENEGSSGGFEFRIKANTSTL